MSSPDNHSNENKENAGNYEILADPSKYVTLPVQNEKIWNLYQTTLEKFWTVYDVYIADDRKSFLAIFNEEQRQYILQMLAFLFTSHYTSINKDLFMQLMSQVDIKEASYYFGSQADTKKTHSMMYSMLLDELLSNDSKKKEKLISDVVGMTHVHNFLRWSILSMSSDTKTFAQRLLAFATLQGIVFTAPFVMFDWLHKQHPKMMPGLNNSNKFIWRDEKLNLTFSCMLFMYIDDKLTEEEAHKIVNEAVTHAKKLFTVSMPVSILGMENNLIEQFIEHSADSILTELRFSKLFNKEGPFDWIEEPEMDKFEPSNNNISFTSYNTVEFNIADDF